MLPQPSPPSRNLQSQFTCLQVNTGTSGSSETQAQAGGSPGPHTSHLDGQGSEPHQPGYMASRSGPETRVAPSVDERGGDPQTVRFFLERGSESAELLALWAPNTTPPQLPPVSPLWSSAHQQGTSTTEASQMQSPALGCSCSPRQLLLL